MTRLRIWWCPAVPAPSFFREVATVEEGKKLLDALVDYTRYLEDRKFFPEYAADAGGIEALEDGEWYDVEFVLDDEAAWRYGGEEE